MSNRNDSNPAVEAEQEAGAGSLSRLAAPVRTTRKSPPAERRSGQPDRCPICHTGSRPLYVIKETIYFLCPHCTHQFADYVPSPTHSTDHYDDQYFSGDGDGYPDYLTNRKLLVAHGRNYAKKIAKLCGKSAGDLLDIGSAAGFLAKGFQERGWTAQGIEPSPAMAEHANSIEGIPTTIGSLENFETDQRFDLIVLAQVIAHLEDPTAAFRKFRKLLRPGGLILVETWDSHSITARILRGRWHEYNPPSVLHAFSRRSLTNLAAQYGFESICNRRITKTINAAHAKSLLEHKFGHSPRHRFFLKHLLKILPDGLNLPYLANDLFWSLLTKP